MSENEKKGTKSILKQNLGILASVEGFQRYVLGSKKDGTPRAIYDVIKDCSKSGKGKNKKKKNDAGKSTYSFYLNAKKDKKKKNKKKKNKDKHWHI